MHLLDINHYLIRLEIETGGKLMIQLSNTYIIYMYIYKVLYNVNTLDEIDTPDIWICDSHTWQVNECERVNESHIVGTSEHNWYVNVITNESYTLIVTLN